MNKVLFIDTLTTGLNAEKCSIYRLGGIFCEETPDSITERQRFDIFVRPFQGARIADTSLWLGSMTRSKLLYFPEQKAAFDDFMKLVGERVNIRNPKDKLYIAGFNASAFDVPFLRGWFARNGNMHFRDCFYVQTLDLMSLAAVALINERDDMADFHLETAAQRLGVLPVKQEKYSCLDNAETCIAMYRNLKERMHLGEDARYSKTEELFTNHKI